MPGRHLSVSMTISRVGRHVGIGIRCVPLSTPSGNLMRKYDIGEFSVQLGKWFKFKRKEN